MSVTLKQRAVRAANYLGWRSNAQNIYFAADKTAGHLIDDLIWEVIPDVRAGIFGQLAQQERVMAEVHMEAFGPRPIPWEDGRDLSESIRWSAVLYDLLADVEASVATGKPREITGSELEPVAGEVLDDMVRVLDVTTRTALARDLLYLAVVDTVGGQAAECLACLPVPGVDDRTFGGIVRNAWKNRKR